MNKVIDELFEAKPLRSESIGCPVSLLVDDCEHPPPPLASTTPLFIGGIMGLQACDKSDFPTIVVIQTIIDQRSVL
jgi:hypothetical protein